MYYDEVCVSVTKKEHFLSAELSAGGAKRDARQALPAVGQLWPSDNDGAGDDNDEDGDGAGATYDTLILLIPAIQHPVQ